MNHAVKVWACCLGVWGCLSVVAVATVRAETVLALDNITIQPGGPRQGSNGQAFFNIEGVSNDSFASYGAVQFDIAEIRQSFSDMFGPDDWIVDEVQLMLTQANASFTRDGSVEIWFIGDDGLDITQSSTLVYPFDAEEFDLANLILQYDFEQIEDGVQEIYTLFGSGGMSSEGGQQLRDDILSDDTVTLMLVDADPDVAATYAGISHGSFAGPTLSITAVPREQAPPYLMAGDADQDFDFDQLDLVQVQVGNKYLSGQPATWGEGDWNGAPGGFPGSPPPGDNRFNQLDIIAAQQAGTYLTGPYNAIQTGGAAADAQTSVGYDPASGELFVDAPAGVELTSINIDSAAGIFTGAAAENLGGSFDNDSDANLFKATFGGSFGNLSFGNVAQPGLSTAFLAADLTVVGSLQGGGDLGPVDLIYVPEPGSALMVVVTFVLGWTLFLRRRP